MQDMQLDQEKKLKYTTELLAKNKNVEDRKFFFFEKNCMFAVEKGFDAIYFLKVIAREKKYLPNNFFGKK